MAYGVTPARYAVAAYGIWLLALALYELARKQRDLAFLFTSGVVVVLLGTWSPVNAFTVSRISQVARLEELLEKRNMLINGVLQMPNTSLIQSFSDADCKDLESILNYLFRTDRTSDLPVWLQDLVRYSDSKYRVNLTKEVTQHLVGSTCESYLDLTSYYLYYSEPTKTLSETYQYVILWQKQLHFNDSGDPVSEVFKINEEEWMVFMNSSSSLEFRRIGAPESVVTVNVQPLMEYLVQLYKEAGADDRIPVEDMLVPFENEFI